MTDTELKLIELGRREVSRRVFNRRQRAYDREILRLVHRADDDMTVFQVRGIATGRVNFTFSEAEQERKILDSVTLPVVVSL